MSFEISDECKSVIIFSNNNTIIGGWYYLCTFVQMPPVQFSCETSYSRLLWLVIVNFFSLSVALSVYYNNNDPCIMVNVFRWWGGIKNIRVTSTKCVLTHSYNNHSTLLDYNIISQITSYFCHLHENKWK